MFIQIEIPCDLLSLIFNSKQYKIASMAKFVQVGRNVFEVIRRPGFASN